MHEYDCVFEYYFVYEYAVCMRCVYMGIRLCALVCASDVCVYFLYCSCPTSCLCL